MSARVPVSGLRLLRFQPRRCTVRQQADQVLLWAFHKLTRTERLRVAGMIFALADVHDGDPSSTGAR